MHNDLKVIEELEALLSEKLKEPPFDGIYQRIGYASAKDGRVIGLNLYRAKISDLAPISSLTALTTLHLEHNQINDLAPLSSLTAL